MPTPIPTVLQQLADLAGREKPWKLRFVRQEDRASAWRAFAIHPMQLTETFYQRRVLDALEAVRDEADDAKRKAESEALSLVFQLSSQPPSLVSSEIRGEFPREQVERALDALRSVSSQLAQARAYGTAPPDTLAAELQQIRQALLVALALAFTSDIREFLALPEVGDCLQRLYAVGGDRAQEIERLHAAASDIASILAGVASVQVSTTIDSFYLFRLLIRHRVSAEVPIDDDISNEASGVVTGLLHNGPAMAWLGDWLFDKLCDLSATIGLAAPGNDVIFFLKGGRAMQDDPRAGQNDWDTQLVINPYLPPDDWYRLFARLHDLITYKLTQYKNELYVLLARQRRALEGLVAGLQAGPELPDRLAIEPDQGGRLLALPPILELDLPIVPIDPLALALADPDTHEGAAKAELIDVGVPRRESPEAFEQWSLVRPRLIPRRRPEGEVDPLALVLRGGDALALVRGEGGDPRACVMAPSGLFFALDFILVLREVFTGESRSAAKSPKRVKRLYDLLGKPATLNEIEGELLLIAGPLARLANETWQQARDAPDGGRAAAILVLFLRQLVRAYDLLEDYEFARTIADLLTRVWPLRNRKRLPPEMASLAGGEAELARCVGTVQDVGKALTEVVRARAAALQNNAELRQLVAGIHAAVRQQQLPMAVVGSAAVTLHAISTHYARPERLEPVYRVDLKLFVPPGTAQDSVRDRIVGQLHLPNSLRVETPTDSPPGTALFFSRALPPRPPNNPLAIANDEVQRLDQGQLVVDDYRPLVLRLTTEIGDRAPITTTIDQLPVLSLRDLLADYTREAGEVDEFSAQAGLRSTLAAIREMLTSFDPPARR
ncbi:hypothetical protein ACNOYE_19550 [Nannocystaceae bacterium ST9]